MKQRGRLLPGLVWLSLGNLGIASHLVAQTAGAGSLEAKQRWELEGVRAGWCVEFLVDSAAAARQVPVGYGALRADQAPWAHPALRRLVAESPEFAGWSPASLCAFYVDAITIADHHYTQKDTTKAEAVSWWGVALTPSGSAVAEQPLFSISLLATNDWRTQKEAEGVSVPIEKIDMMLGKVPESTDDRYQVKISKKAQIVWDGHLTADSALTSPVLERRVTGPGSRNTVWLITSRIQADSSRLIAGSLRVEGKGDLIKALKASPIRMVGPLYLGGSGEITFTR